MQALASVRRHSPWLAVALSALVVVLTLTLTALWPSGNRALGVAGGGQTPDSMGFQGPQQCSECHPTEFREWSGTTHANALFDPIFQAYLRALEEPGECFSCHATGYNAVTGQFVLAGVTCEACHGPYRSEHPGESMTIATSEQLCGACHTSTITEWQASRHGQLGISCVACHEVHTQKARTAASTNFLCAACHQSHTQDLMHQQHRATSLNCVDCHLARPSDSAASAVSGHAMTAHTFTPVISNCQDCHPDQDFGQK